jgi:para-nitrobenzyl esterase
MLKYNLLFLLLLSLTIQAQQKKNIINQPVIETLSGKISGTEMKDGVVSFKGIPFAQPPVGVLRWKEPQPVNKWEGVLKADRFRARPMQKRKYDDMIFRSDKNSEDCLYLNIWAPKKVSNEKFPVLVYFYGGGFSSGDGSEARYDGESMARKGIIAITVNYRLGVFGFLAHPELSKESKHGSSGNYGLLDQNAALVWIKNNIKAFGGDSDRITIGGESAGSMSVSAQMASPLSAGLFSGAICQSGSVLGINSTVPLSKGEENGVNFLSKTGKKNIEELRSLSADDVLELSQTFGFPCVVDGYFLPASPVDIFSRGKQIDIPLLGGWTSAETSNNNILQNKAPTLENYRLSVEKIYGNKAQEILKIYSAKNDEEVAQVATDLASDRYIAYSTWKLIDLHGKTNGHPVYRYIFNRKRPEFIGKGENNANPLGAVHASDIEYALGNLPLNNRYAWTNDDYKTSETMQDFLINFIKTGNPNGPGLPNWYGLQSSIPKVMNIDAESKSEQEKNGRRYVAFDMLLR